MKDDARSPVQHHLVLHRIDPDQGVARFYSLMIERDLFGRIVLVRIWGRIGTHGRELAEEFACEIEASQALEAVAQAKRRRGYRDLYFAEADVMER
jgi:predicted DNA-binding WGR domain protein